MKQILGKKKTRKIEKILGREVCVAYTRGGWDHYCAEVFYYDGDFMAARMVNYKTGEIGDVINETRSHTFKVRYVSRDGLDRWETMSTRPPPVLKRSLAIKRGCFVKEDIAENKTIDCREYVLGTAIRKEYGYDLIYYETYYETG